MAAHNGKPLIAVVLLLVEGSLQLSGYTNPLLAITLFVVAAALLLWWLKDVLPESPFQKKFMGPLILLLVGIVCIFGAAGWYWFTLDAPAQAAAPIGQSVTERRQLSKQQKETLAAQLLKLHWQPADVLLMWDPECDECETYSRDFEEAFTRAGWPGKAYAPLEDHREMTGVVLFVEDSTKPPQSAKLLELALREASIDFGWGGIPGMERGKVYVWICRQEG